MKNSGVKLTSQTVALACHRTLHVPDSPLLLIVQYSNDAYYAQWIIQQRMNQTQKLLATAMVLMGLLQAGLGLLSDNFAFAGYGLIFSLIGLSWFWIET